MRTLAARAATLEDRERVAARVGSRADGYRRDWAEMVERSDLSLLVAPDGFVVAQHGERESLTGQLQTVIWDWAGDPSQWLPLLQAEARERGSQYLVLKAATGQANPFSAFGFLPELTRVARRVEPLSWDGPFQLRAATSHDRMFMATLNSQSMHFYLPAHREVDSLEIAARTMTTYLGLELGEELFGFTIGERRPFGYILLKRLEDKTAYLYDLSLKPEFWGRGAGRILGNYTQSQLHARGYERLLGDISCANPRTLEVATAAIGFQPEWVRWGQRL